MNKKLRTGFTLIELLVVVAVITFILSFVFVSVSGARAKGRDARREEDIKQIQNALDIYHVNRRRYPACAEEVINGSNDCMTQAIVSDGTVSTVPTDPLGGGIGECLGETSYVYCYESADGGSYTLRYRLETDSIPLKSAGWQEARP